MNSTPQSIKELMEEYNIDENQQDACVAYLSATGAIDLEDFEEAYQGEFADDEEFAMQLAEDLGEIDKNAHWPYTYIDWERAAHDLMMDYSEQDGYYFRNL